MADAQLVPDFVTGNAQFVPDFGAVVIAVKKGGGHSSIDHHARIIREDEEILAVIMAYMSTKH